MCISEDLSFVFSFKDQNSSTVWLLHLLKPYISLLDLLQSEGNEDSGRMPKASRNKM